MSYDTPAPEQEEPDGDAQKPDEELVDEHGSPTADWLPESDQPQENGIVP